MTSFLNPYVQESVALNSKFDKDYILTIQYSLDGLSFIIFDIEKQKFVSLKHYTLNDNNISLLQLLSELQEQESWKIDNFYKILFLIDNQYNTFVPAQMFQNDLRKDYLKLLNIPHDSLIATDTISYFNIYNVYPISHDIELSLDNISNRIEVRHASTIIVETLIKEFSNRTPEARAFVNVKNNHFELTIINNCNLIFHNYFNFITKEDFLYFILYTFEQLHIDNEIVPLYFMGFIEESSAIVELCSRYIRNIRFYKRNNNYEYISELDSVPYYYYFTLYNSISCE